MYIDVLRSSSVPHTAIATISFTSDVREEKEIEMMSNKKIVDYWIGLGMPKAYAHRIIKDLH